MVGTLAGQTTLPPAPVLHVECCTIEPEASPAARAEQVEGWLRENCATVGLSQLFVSFPGLNHAENVDFVRIGDMSSSVSVAMGRMISLAEVSIEIDVFNFVEAGGAANPSHSANCNGLFGTEDNHDIAQAKVTSLPNRNLKGAWDSLIFDDPVQYRLLKFLLRMVSLSAQQLQKNHFASWNRLILLYGPPGTGKTTLCRALAQQLSIRLRKTFSSSKLIEIDAHSLFSKYFSESGKAVSKLFSSIESMLNQGDDTFVCVFIDEIESLASTRQHAANSSEPQDTLRVSVQAVNALLIALDSLRNRPNVVILCTSNLIKAMDPAFLDRVDVKLHIPQPCAQARYEILRARYLELADSGIISAADPLIEEELIDLDQLMEGLESPSSAEKLFTPLSSPGPGKESPHNPDGGLFTFNKDDLPIYDIMMLHYYGDESSSPRRLWDIAQNSMNLSGRSLHRLPILSLAMYTTQHPCPMSQALDALSKAVDDELLTEQRLHVDEETGAGHGGGRGMLFA